MASHPRARSGRDTDRKPPSREPNIRVLIVCEGSKTEPLYFDAIRKKYRLPATKIMVLANTSGTQPRQVVNDACTFFEDYGKEFDHVYAVFDRDDHTTYYDALNRAAELNNKFKNDFYKKIPFSAIASVPCFELWLLLHFEDVFEYQHRDAIYEKLKKHLPEYKKGTTNMYSVTEEHLPKAITRAKTMCGTSNVKAGDKPYTNVYELVEKLQSIKQI